MHRPPVKLMLHLAHQLAMLGALIGARAPRAADPVSFPHLPGMQTDERLRQKKVKRRDTKAKKGPRTKPYPKNLGRRDSRRRTG